MGLNDGRQLWYQSIAQAKRAGDLENAVVFFADALAEQFDFQAIVMPSIVLHTTSTTYSWGKWDGVTRRMGVVNAPQDKWTRRSSGGWVDGTRLVKVSGEMAVTSVHLLVFSREGERIFEGRGGLEFTHEIDGARIANERKAEYGPRSDLFEDRAVLIEGIEIAFTPYLSTPAE